MFNKREFNREFTKDMIGAMPEEKKRVLINALDRNCILPSYWGLDNQTVEVYKEGWYINFVGCRCSFTAWVGDNDGEFVFGKRKPRKLSYLHSYNPDIEFTFDPDIEKLLNLNA